MAAYFAVILPVLTVLRESCDGSETSRFSSKQTTLKLRFSHWTDINGRWNKFKAFGDFWKSRVRTELGTEHLGGSHKSKQSSPGNYDSPLLLELPEPYYKNRLTEDWNLSIQRFEPNSAFQVTEALFT